MMLPTVLRAADGSLETLVPLTRISPVEGFIIFVISFINVVFPAPFGPRIPMHPLLSRERLIFFSAAIAVSYIIVSIYTIFEIISYVILFASFPGMVFLYSYLLLLLFIISITAFTFLISSIFNKNMYAYITVFLLYYLIFNALYIILDFLYNYNAFFLLSEAASIIERVFIDINTTVPGSSSISLNGAGSGPIGIAAIVMVIYAVISIAGSLILFDRKEVK